MIINTNVKLKINLIRVLNFDNIKLLLLTQSMKPKYNKIISKGLNLFIFLLTTSIS